MSDLELKAALERAEAAERRVAELQKELDELKKATEVTVPPIPDRFDVERTGTSLAVKWRWLNTKQHVPLLFFVFAWNIYAIAWYLVPSRPSDLLFQIFPIAQLVLGGGLTYFLLGCLLNSTTATARDDRLTIEHSPLPWPGSHRLERARVKQLYVMEDVNASGYKRVCTYNLCALTTSGKAAVLVRKLETIEQARYLESSFEQYFGIRDVAVPNEAPK